MIYVWIFLAAVCILALLSAVYFLLSGLVDRRIARFQSDLLEKHCEEVDNMYRQTRGWRHDYHNHIQTMKVYLELGKYRELGEYLNELDRDLTEVDMVVKTGNVKVDAALNSKISLAKAKHIRVNAKAIVPAQIPFSEVDLSLIIGNLMDNAMEACMKIEEEDKRFIRIYLDVLKGQFYIYVMNAVGEKLKKEGDRYLTTKSSAYHGLGLVRLDRIVKKYHGYLNRQDEGDVFVTEIMLPIV